jgi:hypothetical protein
MIGAFQRSTLATIAAVVALTGCVDPASMVVSSVATATVRTIIDQAHKNRPTPQQLWHRSQVAALEQRAGAGDIEAQFQLGTYHMTRRDPAAQHWICEAASRGHAGAQLQYGHWYNEDRDREDLFPFIAIAPDDATAFLWYSLAERNGEPRATHFRNSLRDAQLPATRAQEVDLRLSEWSPGPCGSTPGLTTAWDAAAAPPPGTDTR